MKFIWLVPLFVVPGMAFAAGGTSKPTTTETTDNCKSGLVWDSKTKQCVAPKNSALDDDTLYEAVREYAYAGQYAVAQDLLAAMSDQSEDRVLTYWGYTHRKAGDLELGMSYYRKALRQNPDNLLARSYMGQAMVEAGHTDAALAQLSQIRARGGQRSWAEQSLEQALQSGSGFSY